MMSKVYKPGDVLLDNCLPYVIQVTDREFKNRCHYCLNKSDKLKSCGQCLAVRYCSKECQVADWKHIHKFNECKLFKETKSYKYDQDDRLLARLVLKVTFDPDSSQRVYKLWDNLSRKLDDLTSHQDKIEQNKHIKANKTIKHLTDQLNKHFDAKLSMDQLWRWYGVIQINSVLVVDNVSKLGYATALYIDGSAIDHDCQPCCIQVFNGRQLQIRTLKTFDLAKEKPTLNYLNTNQVYGRDHRRRLLSERYFFDCHCKRCSENTDQNFDFARYQYLVDNRREDDPEYWDELIKLQKTLLGEHHPLITHSLSQKFFAMGSTLPPMPSAALIKKLRECGQEFERELKVTHDERLGQYADILQTVRQLDQAHLAN